MNKLTYKINNKGSGLVAVLITVAFIAALGSIMLYMGFVNVNTKVADRGTRGNFYETEQVIDIDRKSVV